MPICSDRNVPVAPPAGHFKSPCKHECFTPSHPDLKEEDPKLLFGETDPKEWKDLHKQLYLQGNNFHRNGTVIATDVTANSPGRGRACFSAPLRQWAGDSQAQPTTGVSVLSSPIITDMTWGRMCSGFQQDSECKLFEAL